VTKPWTAPEVSLVDIRLGQVTTEQQTFVLRLNVKNPNDRTLPIKGASYNLEIEDHEIASGTSSLEKQIPAYDSGVVDVLVNINMMELIRGFPELSVTGGKWDYRVSGVIKVAGGYIPLPFRYSGEIDAAQIISGLMR
jgi:LEA14-like dessication related protein